MHTPSPDERDRLDVLHLQIRRAKSYRRQVDLMNQVLSILQYPKVSLRGIFARQLISFLCSGSDEESVSRSSAIWNASPPSDLPEVLPSQFNDSSGKGRSLSQLNPPLKSLEPPTIGGPFHPLSGANQMDPKKEELMAFLNEHVFEPILNSQVASEKLKKGIRYTIMRMNERDAAGCRQYYWSAIIGTDRSINFAAAMRDEGFTRFEDAEVLERFRQKFTDEWLRS